MPIYEDNTSKTKKYYFKVYYTDTNGKYKQYKSKRFELKRDCVKAEAEFRSNISKYKQGSPITFNQLADEYMEYRDTMVKPHTKRATEYKLSFIRSALGDVKVEKLSPDLYREFWNNLNQLDLSVHLKNNILGLVKRLCKFSNQMHNVTSSVPLQFDNFKDLNRRPKEYNIYTLDEFNQFISAVDDQIYRALFTTLFYCGLRRGEALALTWNDIDFEKHTMNISKTIDCDKRNAFTSSPKTISSNRILPMPQIVESEIKKVHDLFANEYGFVDTWFVFGGPKCMSGATLKLNKKKYTKISGLKEIRIHDFRHSCASLLINTLRVPITSVCKYLGHENPQITLTTYSHFYQENLEQIASGLDKIGLIHS